MNAQTRDGAAGRVLILSENESVPSDRRVWDISRTLRSFGYEVVVVCPQGLEDEQLLFERSEGIEIHRYPLRFADGGLLGFAREYLTALWRTWRLVGRLSRERPFTIVHACNPPDFLLLAAGPARRRGASCVFDHHDVTPELFLTRFGDRHPLVHRATMIVERAAFRAADVTLATNESYRRLALARGRKHPDDVFVVRNGPDLRRFRPVAPDASLRQGAAALISYVGVMAPQDGVDHALRALAALAGRREDWHAVLAGDGDSRLEMIELAAQLGLRDKVSFPGWIDDARIARLLCSSDVCLAPEPRTPLNDVSTMVKIAEYLAMSRPVVAYGLPESRLAAGDAALYAEDDDPESFADCIAQLLDDPAQRERMGAAGRRRVESELSWEHSEIALRAAYEAAAARARRPVRKKRVVQLVESLDGSDF